MDLIDMLTDLYNVLWTPFEMLLKKARNYTTRITNALLLVEDKKRKFLYLPQISEQLKHSPTTKFILLTVEKQSRDQHGCRVFGLSANKKYLWDMVVKYDEDVIKQGTDYYIVL